MPPERKRAPSKDELRAIVRDQLGSVVGVVNAALAAKGLSALEATITRIGRGGRLPHWYEGLKNGRLPNLDGKTVGSVLEMLFVAALETGPLHGIGIPPLRINPARGIDLPDLDLGVKCPSTNYCTSEPFFSAYERLYGNEYDAVILLTDYQDAKKKTPFNLKIVDQKFLRGTEIADRGLCTLARMHREKLVRESVGRTQRFFRFLAYVNQSDWRAKQLLMLAVFMFDDAKIDAALKSAERDFTNQNESRDNRNMVPFPDSDLRALLAIRESQPHYMGILDAMDNWISEIVKDAGRAPNENEWVRLRSGPLDGKIGMSFALQWRYNFGQLFRGNGNLLDQLVGSGDVGEE